MATYLIRFPAAATLTPGSALPSGTLLNNASPGTLLAGQPAGSWRYARISVDDVAVTIDGPATGDVIANDGTVSNVVLNGDGSITFAYDATNSNNFDTTYTIPADVVAAGYAWQGAAPAVTTTTSGGIKTFTRVGNGMTVSPADDVAEVTYGWRVSGEIVGLGDVSYVSKPGDDKRLIEQVTVLPNVQSEADGVDVVYATTLQAASSIALSEMVFKAADSDTVIWSSPTLPTTATEMAMFSRFKMTPDAGDTDFRTAILTLYGSVGPLGIYQSEIATLFARANVRLGTTSRFSSPVIQAGDIVDVVFAANHSLISNQWRTSSLTYVNGVLADTYTTNFNLLARGGR